MPIRLGAITDEFSPDLETAARAMSEAGLEGAELRMISGKNVVDLTDEELAGAIGTVRGYGLEIVSIASPLLKCVLPDSPDVDERFHKDMFASAATFDDQPRIAARTFEIAKRTGAKIVRVFSYWRTIRPEECFDRIVEALSSLAVQAGREGLVIGLENEHACNVATGAELARALEAVNHPNLKAVWDPANALVAGESPFPEGYGAVVRGRIAHVHAKDCWIRDGQPVWGPLGECQIDWRGQIRALLDDGYEGWINLETHWSGPAGDKLQGSRLCARNLRDLLEHARSPNW
jgi:sugar phosphate isomerase/epimerase